MDEFDELLDSQLPPDSADGLIEAIRAGRASYAEDLRNTIHKEKRNAAAIEDPYGLDWSKLSSQQAAAGYQAMTGVEPIGNIDTQINRVKMASNNSVNSKKILNEQDQYEDFTPEQWGNSAFKSMGYNNFLYERPVEGTQSPFQTGVQASVSAASGSSPAASLISDFFSKFDSEQQYDFLVPAVDPTTGEEILRRVRGTYKDVAKNGYNVLNRYGANPESSNVISSALKSFANTIGETDDVLLSFAKYAQDAALFVSGNKYASTQLDDVYEATVTDTDRSRFLTSEKSDEFGTLDWFASGTGSAFASLLQFGGVGRSARALGSGIEAVASRMGSKAAKNLVANRVATLGASGVIGFGYAYNEALQNGLEEGDALLYGTLVGSVNSAIELALGPQFDAYLTGGGPKAISREILSEMGGEVTEASTRKFVREKLGSYLQSIPGRLGNMASEGGEEVLQDVVEQGSKISYNALFADEDAQERKGKFDIREFDFTQVVAAGIFGAAAAAPFNSNKMSMAQRVMKGDGQNVKQAIEDLLSSGQITRPQYESQIAEYAKLQEAYNLNKNLLDGISGEFADVVRAEGFQLISKRAELQAAQRKMTEGLQNNPEQSGQVNDQVKEIDAKILELSSQIAKYGDAEFLKTRVQAIKQARENAQVNRDNVFGRIAASVNYTTDADVEATKKRIGSLTAADFKSQPIARTAEEASNVLRALPSLDPSIGQALAEQMRVLKWHTSPTVNTTENRQALLSLGFTPEQIPLTSEEKLDAASNPEAYQTRYLPEERFRALIESVPLEGSSIDKIQYLLANPDFASLTEAQLHSLDNRQVLSNYLRTDHLSAISRLMATSVPASLYIASGDEPSARGFFENNNKFIAVTGALSKIEKATGKEKTRLQDHLFHVITHELGHSLFNRDLAIIHRAWIKRASNQPMSPQESLSAEYFNRLLSLARVADAALGTTKEARGLYFFNDIAPQWNSIEDTRQKAIGALSYVQEFYSETLSNQKFQQLLDSFDINDPKNKAILDKFSYAYEKPEVFKRETLLSQAIKAVASVFQKLGTVLSRQDRTILTEAFVLGSTADFNRFYITSPESEVNRNIAQLSISSYAGINIFEGEEVDRDQLLANLYKRLEKAGVRLNPAQREELLDAIKKFTDQEIFSSDADEFLGGSLIVVYFKATDDFMISWKSIDGEGNTNSNRAFFNKYGNRKEINTDVENYSSASTMSKPNAFEAFSRGAIGEQASENRRMLNDLERAITEDFSGEAFLELDKNYTWKFDGKDIQGQIAINYTFSDGSVRRIGYAPDLAKVRLAHLLSNGASIKVKLQRSPGSTGSMAYVRRDEDGQIIEARKITDMTSSEAIKQGYESASISPKTRFFYLPSSVPAAAQAAADAVDTITPDNKRIAPKVTMADLVSGAEILRSGYFNREIFSSFSLYNPQNPDFQAGTVDSRIQYVRDGLPRFLRRVSYFSINKELIQDDLYRFAAEYNNRAAEYIKATIPAELQQSAALYGFQSEDESTQFVVDTIDKIMADHRTSGNIAQEDWSGMGGNPSGRISAGIKADIEALNFEHDNQKQWIDFGDAKDILFENSKGTRTLEDIVKNIGSAISAKQYGGRRMAIAKSIYNHLSGASDLDAVKNSYWSQFASYVRLDAATIGVAPDGTTRLYMNGERSYLNKQSSDYASSIQRRMNQAIDSVVASGQQPSRQNVMNEIKRRINEHFIDEQVARLINRGVYVSESEARSAAESFLLTKDGKPSTIVSKITSFKSNFPLSSFNLNGYSSKGIMAPFTQRFFDTFGVSDRNSGAGYESYQRTADMLQSYFSYFGIEPPTSMFTLRQNVRNLQFALEKMNALVRQGASVSDAQASIRRAMDSMSINDYFKVEYKPKGSDRVEDVPFVSFAAQLVDYIDLQMSKQASGDSFDYKVGEMDVLSKAVMRMDGSYRSPEFYFNAEFSKEWALKIRSYSDTLVEQLSSEDSDLLSKYLSTDLYKNNRFLKTIQKYRGQAPQVMLSGIKSIEDGGIGKGYSGAGDLDFLYMNLGAFVHNYSADTYFHVDDVPSDKPRTSLFRMSRMKVSDLKGEIDNIIAIENHRFKMANQRFDAAFDVVDDLIDGKAYYRVTDKSAFNKLVPGVHYGKAIDFNGEKLYPAGWIFDRKNYFYGGGKSDAVARQIEEESIKAYNEFRRQGANFPVTSEFMNDLSQRSIPEDQRSLALAAEQERIFREWYVNYVINRYHLSQVLKGDYIYYKQDKFSDLNKRHAGTAAPSSKGVFTEPSIKVVYLNDADLDESYDVLTLPKMKLDESSNRWVIDEDVDQTELSPNRTDAQGYLTEQFAAEIQQAYGSFSGYEKVFKPVVYGVNESNIATGQPIYLKLSLAVLPDPDKSENQEHYRQYPKQLELAMKIYSSGARFAVFNSGIKVGVNTLNNLSDDEFTTTEIDSSLFGLQNNPYHDPNSDENYISGMVQQTKQLGDNDNFNGVMAIYHEIEGKLVDREVQAYINKRLESLDGVREVVKNRLEKNSFSAPIAAFIDDDLRVLDNPVTASYAENLLNAGFRDAISLYPKDGEKLVNVSELGFERPVVAGELEERSQILAAMGMPDTDFDRKLRWAGPRTPMDLTAPQLRKLQRDLTEGAVTIGNDLNILDSAGNIKIYPAEVLVPEGPNYKIGDRLIATRIPTSKKSSSIPSEVVGFVHPSQGNLIVVGKHGTAVLGFDFDIDGLFVWRERQRTSNHKVREMFGIAFDVLTSPKNYNELTSPTVTDNVARIASEVDAITGRSTEEYSHFSPMRQLQLKKLNSIGKTMIGVAASASGIHSVLEQNGGSPFLSTPNEKRGYLIDGALNDSFRRTVTDPEDGEMMVTDIYSEFINAATDNAKLQLLGRLNANPVTAGVLFDMISHGASMRYALYFINQPVIRELVRLTENSTSASALQAQARNGIPAYLFKQLEEAVRELGGEYSNYSFAPKTEDGLTDPSSKAISRVVEGDMGGLKIEKADRVDLSLDALRGGMARWTDTNLSDPAEKRFRALEMQMVVLDKFNYYKSLAAITANAGKLVTLTSGYPKDFVELLDRRNKIADALLPKDVLTASGEVVSVPPPIKIDQLIDNHGMYRVHWNRINDLLAKYADMKAYASPAVVSMHNSMAKGKSIDIQKRLHDDFYTYLLSQESESDNENFIYNLSTSSLTGEPIHPYDFVNTSAQVIAELKKSLPQNEFLRILDVRMNNRARETDNRVGRPSQVIISLSTDPDGEMLERIHAGFNSLPANFKTKYWDIADGEKVLAEVNIKSTKDLLLGHLLYSQGFKMGGFSFSKLLPVSTVKFLDSSSQVVFDRLSSYMELNPIGENDVNDIQREAYYQEVLNDAGLTDFIQQAKLNIPELINEIPAYVLQEAIKSDAGHFLQWSPDTHVKGTVYDGLKATLPKADGGERVVFHVRSKNAEMVALAKRIVRQGMVRMPDSKGSVRVFRVVDAGMSESTGKNGQKYSAKLLTLETVNFMPNRFVKQYGSVFESNLSNAAIEAGRFEEIGVADSLEPESLAEVGMQPASATHPVIESDFFVDANAAREGRQTAILATVDPAVIVNQIVVIPSAENQSVMARAKKVWPINSVYQRALSREPELATGKMLSWISRTSDEEFTSLEEVLDKYLVEFEYVATIGGDGVIQHQEGSEFNEDGSRINPASFSEYNPRKSSGFYKSLMLKAGETLKLLPTLIWDDSLDVIFNDQLSALGVDPIQRQIIKDYIANSGAISLNSDQISDGLIAMAQSADTLEQYNTSVGYDRNTDTPLEKLYDVSVSVLGPVFDSLAEKFEQYMDTPMQTADEFMINPETKLPYTYYEWLAMHFDKYIREERLMNEYILRYGDNPDAFELEELKDVYANIRQGMGAANGLIWKKNNGFIQDLGHAIGKKAEIRSFDIIGGKTQTGGAFAQRDIKTWEEQLTSITDFTERQAAMQEVGRQVSEAAVRSEAEKNRTTALTNRLMKELLKYHYADKPVSWVDKLNPRKRSAAMREAFDWMLERDGNGEYTGRMVARYAENEKQLRDTIFERVMNQQGDATYFRISNRKVLGFVMSNTGGLTASEAQRVSEIAIRYNNYIGFFDQWRQMTEEQKAQSGKDTTFIRNMWVKVKVRQEDSQLFKDLKVQAQGTSPQAKLAQAKIALYDYLSDRSNELLDETGYFSYPLERGIMPQTEADFNEDWSRYGFSEAWSRFRSETRDEIDNIQTQHGVVISTKPIIGFETSKKVPFRTLRRKENFSVNVPAIFEHHFNSLIFKKHYDKVLPFMDAIQTHYSMKKSMGEGAYDNLEKFISEYADQRIFFKKTDGAKSTLAKYAKLASSLTVTAFLGLAPLTSAINWSVGNLETWKHLMGDYGFGAGNRKFQRGLRRMYKLSAIGKSVLDPKALAIMDYYGIETFANNEIVQGSNPLAALNDLALYAQKNGEIAIRGAALFAEMTDAQWNAFDLNADGSLAVNEKDAPKPLEVAEWKNRIGSIQGKYDDEAKRLYHGNVIFQQAMLFKGWLIDYMRSRIGGQYFDQFGIEREGYYRTGWRLIAGSQTINGVRHKNLTRYLEYLKGKDTLTPLEQQNVRKIYFDMAMKAAITLLSSLAGGGEDDERSKDWYLKYLGKVSNSMFLLTSPSQIVNMIKNPFPSINLLESSAKAVEAALDLDVEKAARAGYGMVPGRQLVELAGKGAKAIAAEAEEDSE